MNDISHLPAEQQIELTKEYIKNSENHIKHYSSNPIKLDGMRFKIQTQGLTEHNKKLHQQLQQLENNHLKNKP